MKELHSCAWCDSKVNVQLGSHRPPHFCPSCEHDFEVENGRSLHPIEERHPHDD